MTQMKCRVDFLQVSNLREYFLDLFSYETACDVLCFGDITAIERC